MAAVAAWAIALNMLLLVPTGAVPGPLAPPRLARRLPAVLATPLSDGVASLLLGRRSSPASWRSALFSACGQISRQISSISMSEA